MKANTAGTPPIIRCRTGIGEDSLVRAVMAVLSVVQCVPSWRILFTHQYCTSINSNKDVSSNFDKSIKLIKNLS